VGLREGDNVLPVDRENPMSLEAMLDATHGQSQFTLIEMPGFGTPGVVSGAEGTFANEIVVPFVRSAPVQVDADAAEAIPTYAFDGTITKDFLPGSEWLFVRFHTVPGFADSLLTRTLRPFVRELIQEGLALNWFFIRYADPDFHIRLRILCNTAETAGVLLARIRSIAEELVRRGLCTKIAYDTYDREVARYGGPAGIDLCEGIFGADSEAVLDLVDCTPHDEGANVRWQLTLCGMDALLNDLGFGLEKRYFLATKMAENYGREFNLGPARHQIQGKFRRERRVLMSLMNGSKSELADLQPGLDILARRSDRLEPAATELRLRSEAGRLASPLSDIAGSLLHMHANRMLPTAARAQEAILYQFLVNLYDSELSRSGRKKRDRQG
jgi:thiopeptide-type bacteriocin biosynthesis protein